MTKLEINLALFVPHIMGLTALGASTSFIYFWNFTNYLENKLDPSIAGEVGFDVVEGVLGVEV